MNVDGEMRFWSFSMAFKPNKITPNTYTKVKNENYKGNYLKSKLCLKKNKKLNSFSIQCPLIC